MRSPSLYKTKAELSSWFCFVIFFVLILASPNAFCGINEWTYVGLAPEHINSIAVATDNPDLIYATALDIYWDSLREGGLFRTTDHGLTWDTLGFRHSNVFDVAISPQNSQIIWIANDYHGAFRSTDGGQTWENRSEGIYIGGIDYYGPEEITICPYNTEYLLCGTGSWVSSGYCYLSSTGGNVWQHNNVPLIGAKRFIEFDKNCYGLVYALAQNDAFLWTSTDTGRTFSRSSELPWTLLDLKTAPQSQGSVWLATYQEGIQRSDDSGRTWTQTIEPLGIGDSVISSIDIVGTGDTVAIATAWGPYLTLNAGSNVFPLSQGYPFGLAVIGIKIICANPLEIWVVRGGGGGVGVTHWIQQNLHQTPYKLSKESILQPFILIQRTDCYGLIIHNYKLLHLCSQFIML